MDQFKKLLYKRFENVEAIEKASWLELNDKSPQSVNKNLLGDFHLVWEYEWKTLHVFYILDRGDKLYVTAISCDEYSCEEWFCMVN